MEDNMYLVIGANGYVGSYVLKNILETTKDSVIATATNPLQVVTSGRVKWVQADVTKKESLLKLNKILLNEEPCKIVYLAAYHHPDKVEENPKLSWEINIIGLATFLNTIENVQCFFYASTDSVYGESVDGHRYKEADVLSPVNLYGRHKVLAENLVITYGYNVIRYPFLIGPSLLQRKQHFFDTILSTVRNGNGMEMFVDSYRSSLDFNTAAKVLVNLMESYTIRTPQILNISGDYDLSKYDVATMMADKYALDKNLIIPVHTKDDKSIFVAKRSQSTLLDNTLVKKVLGIDSIRIDI